MTIIFRDNDRQKKKTKNGKLLVGATKQTLKHLHMPGTHILPRRSILMSNAHIIHSFSKYFRI